MTDRVRRSLLDWFLYRGEASPERTALWVPQGASYQPLTWGQWNADVWRAAAALAAWGVRPGDRVAQLSENRYEWLVADLALQCVQAIQVPLHAPQSAAQVAQEIQHCGATLVLASTSAQLAKLERALLADEATVSPQGRPPQVWVFDRDAAASVGFAGRIVLSSWHDHVAGADLALGERLARQTAAAARPDDVLKILYTSGTTGRSKGVVLTQGNLLFNAQALAFAYGERPHERKLSFLALSHVFAQTNDFYSTLVAGCEMALARSRDTVFEDCQRCRPTFINGVPSFYQHAYRTLRRKGGENARGALRQLLGGRIELCNAGGAPLPERLHEYFYSQDIPLLQGYGLTETSPVISVSTPDADRAACVGRPLAGVEVDIAADGEILTRGPHVSPGYYRDDKATADAMRGGWFHTGDLGSLDSDGFLRITGRKKEMIALANGRKVSPLVIEAALLADPIFRQVIVFGEGHNHLVALVRLDTTELGRESIARRIRTALADRAPWEQIRDFAILPEPLSIERGELTAKGSLRRAVIEDNYAEMVDALYGEAADRP